MKYITLAMLNRRLACSDQVEEFKAVFGTRAEITMPNARKARDHGLNLRWLARNYPQYSGVFINTETDAGLRYLCRRLRKLKRPRN